jgi:OHCU decarboxylase
MTTEAPGRAARAALDRLNHAPAGDACAMLLACCGSRAWARRMADARPFADLAALLAAADRIWDDLGPADRLEAFAAHPRIGESPEAIGSSSSRAARWSSSEQAGVAGAGPRLTQSLAEANRRYEERFGHIFLVCATGKSASQILEALASRLENDPARELDVASAEQRRITALRLERLVGEGVAGA